LSLVIGSAVDGYEILDYVDSSSKRISYRARNKTTQRIEQLQILPEAIRADPERSGRFFRESRILASLQHPNIVTFYGAVEVGGCLALSMESLEAVTLNDRLELGPMEIDDAARTILQVIAATDAAHAAGVVHREISPTNILITPDNLVKLSGFAAAKSAGDANLTRAGMLVGDVYYTAPEVFKGLASMDPRIDVYSIGCVFYTLVTGRPPFTPKGEYQVMMAHVTENPVPPSLLNPKLNELLDAVILKALSKDPADRYPSARDFYNAIVNPSSIVHQPPAVPEPAAPPPEVAHHPLPPPPASESVRLLPALLAAAFGAIVLISAFFLLSATRSIANNLP
jgi:serine/threonine protein kinase